MFAPKRLDIMELMNMMSDSDSQREKKELTFPLIEAQKDELNAFLKNTNALQVGDYVELTAVGKHSYRFPIEGQVAQVSMIFDKPVINDRCVFNGEIVCVCPHGHVETYIVDLRMYQRVQEAA